MFSKPWNIRMKSHHQAAAPLYRLPTKEDTLSGYLKNYDPPQNPRCIYIHVPFCVRICTFCNLQRFNCMPPKNYADLILRQIKQLQTIPYIRDGKYESVYLGGGTPTALEAKQLSKILQALRNSFHLVSDAEISVESSITELDDEKLELLRDEGVNRLSIGIQTFSDRGRKLLGRRDTGDSAAKRLACIIEKGFSNTNIDLIYNYPEQTQAELESDIEHVLKLNIAGLSYYSLILGSDSLLTRRLGMDNTAYAQATLEKDIAGWNQLHRSLSAAGFETLELTKLVRPGRDDYRYIRIRHNNGDTLPLGAGAGGRIGNLLLHNPSDPTLYAASLERPLEHQYQGRLIGDSYNYISRQIGKIQLGYLDWEETPLGLEETFAKLRDFVLDNGLGYMQNRRLILNSQGIFWGNNIANRYADLLVKQTLDNGKISPDMISNSHQGNRYREL